MIQREDAGCLMLSRGTERWSRTSDHPCWSCFFNHITLCNSNPQDVEPSVLVSEVPLYPWWAGNPDKLVSSSGRWSCRVRLYFWTSHMEDSREDISVEEDLSVAEFSAYCFITKYPKTQWLKKLTFNIWHSFWRIRIWEQHNELFLA